MKTKILCEPDPGTKERRENDGFGELKFIGREQKLRFRSQQSFNPVSNSEVFRRKVNKENLGSSYCAQESRHETLIRRAGGGGSR